MYSHRSQTIKERTVDVEDYFVLHISPGTRTVNYDNDTFRLKQSELYFFQVADVSNIVYKPLRFRDSGGNPRGPVASGSHLDYNQLYRDNGEDVLANDENAWRVYQFSVGMKQPYGRLYPRLPEGQNGGAWTYLRANDPNPDSTQGEEKAGYIEAEDTDYDNPSAQLEAVMWEEGERTPFQLGYLNDSPYQIDPILSVVGQAYDLRPVVEDTEKSELLSEIMRSPSNRDVDVLTLKFTRNVLRSYSFEVPGEWNDSDNSITVSRANLPSSIETMNGGR